MTPPRSKIATLFAYVILDRNYLCAYVTSVVTKFSVIDSFDVNYYSNEFLKVSRSKVESV